MVDIKISNTLEAHLHDFFIGFRTLRGPVDVFVVINLSDYARNIVVVLHDGKGNIRLESQQLSIGVSEGDYLISG